MTARIVAEEIAMRPIRFAVAAALDNTKRFVGTAGVFTFSATDHNGLDVDAFEMVTVKDGKFVLLGK